MSHIFIFLVGQESVLGLLTLSLSQRCSHLKLKSTKGESASKLTPVVIGSIHFLPGCWTEALSSSVPTHKAFPYGRSQHSWLHWRKQARWQECQQNIQSHSLYNLISDVTFCHCCHIL